MARFYLKNLDTLPILEVALLNPDDSAHDLTGASAVYLHVERPDGVKLQRTMTIESPPTSGLVSYTWLAADWAADALIVGRHKMEYEVVTSPARITFPTTGFDELIIGADIGQGA